MPATLKEGVAELASKFADLYKEMVTNSAQFEELRKSTKETVSDFKNSLEKLEGKIEQIEKDRIIREVELLSKINALEARFNALSEKAFHRVAREAAEVAMQKIFVESTDISAKKLPHKRLPSAKKKTKRKKKSTR
jgi:hypothetical protein